MHYCKRSISGNFFSVPITGAFLLPYLGGGLGEGPKFLYDFFYRFSKKDRNESNQNITSVIGFSELNQIQLNKFNLTSINYLGDAERLKLTELAKEINNTFLIYDSVLELKNLCVNLSLSPNDAILRIQFNEKLKNLEKKIDLSQVNALQTQLISELERNKLALSALSDRLYQDQNEREPTLEASDAKFLDYKITNDLAQLADFDLKTIGSNKEFLRLKGLKTELRKLIAKTKVLSVNHQALAEDTELLLDGWL